MAFSRLIPPVWPTMPADCMAEAVMKIRLACMVVALACVGCGSLSPRQSSPRLVSYRAHAGAPVGSFRLLGRLDSWESLGDGALAVWTRPNEAWLLDVYGACPELEYSVAIGLTDHVGMVESGSDEVRILNQSSPHVRCTIRSIRPLDVDAIRAADRAAKGQPPPAAH
jgi:hypothetical protein